jgi:hypothetical protein
MRKAIIIVAALALPISASAQGDHPKPAKHGKQKAQAQKGEGPGQAQNPGMVFIGPDGKMVDMKKDKCWNANDKPYRSPGWC